jgi:hypothetical protein
MTMMMETMMLTVMMTVTVDSYDNVDNDEVNIADDVVGNDDVDDDVDS